MRVNLKKKVKKKSKSLAPSLRGQITLILSSLPLQLERMFRHPWSSYSAALFRVFSLKISKIPQLMNGLESARVKRIFFFHTQNDIVISLTGLLGPPWFLLWSACEPWSQGHPGPGTPGLASTRAKTNEQSPWKLLLRSPARWRCCPILPRTPPAPPTSPLRWRAASTLGTAAFSLTIQAFFQNLIRQLTFSAEFLSRGPWGTPQSLAKVLGCGETQVVKKGETEDPLTKQLWEDPGGAGGVLTLSRSPPVTLNLYCLQRFSGLD